MLLEILVRCPNFMRQSLISAPIQEIFMTEEHKKQLQSQLWNIANTLRGKMGADEFRDYILGFIFGTVLAMTLFALLMGTVSSFAQNGHNRNLFLGIRFIGGLLAILIGVYWML